MNDAPASSSPSLASLGKALAIASGIALALLVLVVLPAERNLDITGFGKAIGITVLSAPKAEATPTPPAMAKETDPSGVDREDQAVLDLEPGRGLEYKVHVRAGEKLKYSWKSGPGELFYDFHGEPRGAAKDVFESYAAGRASSAKGTLTTPFEGTHGWYWKNTGTTSIRITLDTSGRYEVLGVR